MMKRIAQAWGFAAILLLPNYVDMTSSAGDARIRFPTPLTRIALAHLTDMVIVAVVFGLFMAGLRSMKRWHTIRWVLMGVMPVFLLARNLNVIPFDVQPADVVRISLIWIGMLALVVRRFTPIAHRLRTFGSSLLVGFAVFGLVVAGQLVRAAIWRPGPQAFAKPVAAPAPDRPRLVWILFDELAYKYTFEGRDPSLHLPNFDRLRAASTLYTDVTPIADRTTQAVPTLMLGRQVKDVEYTQNNEYLIRTADSSRWEPFNADASLFGVAKQHGVTTSIVGWYVAYCPIFANVATECYWSNDDAQDRGPTWLDASYPENVWFPLRILAEQFLWPRQALRDDARRNAEGHIASVRDLTQHALDTLANSQADILYLHLPTPHPPGFWNRRTGQYAIGGSYLDSLDYSDRLVGEMLDELEKQPRWAKTTLIVQGDHAWRATMWRNLPGWNREDERVSHRGAPDLRPLVLVHAAGQENAETVTAPTSLLFIHDRVAAEIKAIAR
ncbi:MAG TPA: sulfatase-like hydrolase/transferase [Terracidiphilus sp.]|nr:sulfatase-like hydrolase/transferase [Terracidiphilus sp.]